MAPSRPTVLPQDDAVASASSSPASLLWAHQLKREHGFLLERMTKVETGHHAFDARIRSVEATTNAMSSTVEDVKQSVEDKGAIDDARAAWIGSAETRLELMKDGVEKLKGLQPRVSELEAQFDGMEDRVQQVLLEHQSILQKIRAIEADAQPRKEETGTLVRMNEPNNIHVLIMRLDAMESYREDEQRKTRAMQDRIAGLERTCQTHMARNDELLARLNAAPAVRDQPLPSTEEPTQVVQFPDTRDHPLPSTEVPTQVVDSPVRIDYPVNRVEVATQVVDQLDRSYVQVPASPPFGSVNERIQPLLREKSPVSNAQNRKTVKAARKVKRKAPPSRRNAQVVKPQPATQSPSLTPDLDEPYRRTNVPNSGKRRKPVLWYEPPQTRSQTRSQIDQCKPILTSRRPTKIVVLKLSKPVEPPAALRRPTRPGRGMKRSQSPQGGPRGEPVSKKRAIAPDKKPVKRKPQRKRTEIQQLEALESFIAT